MTVGLTTVLLAAGCGGETRIGFQCSNDYGKPAVRFFGPYEPGGCNPGEAIMSAKLERMPDGTPMRLVVECAKVLVKCE